MTAAKCLNIEFSAGFIDTFERALLHFGGYLKIKNERNAMYIDKIAHIGGFNFEAQPTLLFLTILGMPATRADREPKPLYM